MFLGQGFEPQPIEIDSDIDTRSLSEKFEYINENVPGPTKEVELDSDERFFQFHGCSCSSGSFCSEKDCSCIQRFGPTFDSYGILINVDPQESKMRPVLECNSECGCGDSCPNRVVQNGVKFKLKIFCTERKGFGVKALEPIQRNSFVCEYVGEILTADEARHRTRLLSPSNTNFIMTVNEHLECRREVTYIDPIYKGNVGRFVNHSCDPNLFLIPVRVDHSYPRVAMFALRDIDVDEELSYDYANDFSHASNSNAMDVSPARNSKSRCFCESVNCRNYLPMDSNLYLSS